MIEESIKLSPSKIFFGSPIIPINEEINSYASYIEEPTPMQDWSGVGRNEILVQENNSSIHTRLDIGAS